MRPFIIYALPRSKTFWLSKFLAYGSRTVLHDICVENHTITDIKNILQRPNIGIVDTGLVDGWRLVKSLVPQAKIAVIRRPIKDVCNSLKKFGIEYEADAQNRRMDLDEVSEQSDVFTAQFNDLDNEDTIKEIWDHCLCCEFDRDWWLFWRDKNLQIDMPERIKRLTANHDKIEALKAEVARMAA